MATSGPGATNLVTGIADAFIDSVPIVAITGQVPTTLLGTDAFQEVDTLGITMPIVKHSFLVKDVMDLPTVVHEAFRIARSGRPGPVLIDLPKDVANADGAFMCVPSEETTLPEPDEAALRRAAELLKRSRRPLIYAGGGIGIGKSVLDFRFFVRDTRIPVVSTLKGLGSLPTNHPLFLGMLGMHGLKAANLAVQNCDLLIVVGARFDDRATGKLAEFAPKAKVIHLDADAAEVGKLRRPDVSVVGDLRPALQKLRCAMDIEPWRDECMELKYRHAWDYEAPTDRIYAPRFLRDLSEAADENTILACDVGQHQMWVAQHCRILRPEFHLTSGGLGAMGFGLPAAIGAQLGRPNARVINVSGDGSFLMNVQELATIGRYQLPVKILILDNSALGMVRQWQELFCDRRYSEVDLSDNPDFVAVAESFGIAGIKVEYAHETDAAIEQLVRGNSPLLVHAKIDPAANVWPLVPPGANNEAMMEGEHR